MPTIRFCISLKGRLPLSWQVGRLMKLLPTSKLSSIPSRKGLIEEEVTEEEEEWEEEWEEVKEAFQPLIPPEFNKRPTRCVFCLQASTCTFLLGRSWTESASEYVT